MRPEERIPDGALVSEIHRLTDLSSGAVDEVARKAGQDSGVDPALLGGYLELTMRGARSGRSLSRGELNRLNMIGDQAAESGVDLAALLDLYLSATWRLWREISFNARGVSNEAVASVADSLFRSSDDAAQALGKGFEEAQRLAIRREEALRREFVDDLLSGTVGGLDRLREGASALGFNLLAPHRVLVAQADRPVEEGSPLHLGAEMRVRQALGRDDLVVATKEGRLVCVVPEEAEEPGAAAARALEGVGGAEWRVGEGRVESGPAGVARSYAQAREALELARSVNAASPVATYDSLLVYHLLLNDRAELQLLVDRTLGGLEEARGGAEPFIETLEVYLAEGGNVSAAARRLHLSARAVSHRLTTITRRTGRRLQDPQDRFLLEVAVRAHRLLQT